MLNDIFSKDIAEKLREHGFNIIPISPGTKMPQAGADVMDWKRNGCNIPILNGSSIAMLHGEYGGTWASDFDDPTILDDLIKDKDKQKKMMIVKTPKQGHHIIWALDPEDKPPKDTYFTDSKGRKIDIRFKGYTLLPPSIHPDAHLGRYQFLNEYSGNDLPIMKWSHFLSEINKHGYFSSDDKSEIGAKGGKFTYSELIIGKFKTGERRRKQKALYIKKRMMGSTEEECRQKLEIVNQTCKPPFDSTEFESNIRSAESFFNNITVKDDVITNGINVTTQEHNANVKKENSHYVLANVLMEEYDFISHISKEIYFYGNGVYIPHGEELIHNKCRKYWEEVEINSADIMEIVNIIRDKNIVIPHNNNQEMFNLDYNKIILTNGVLDLKTGDFSNHDSKILSTIKHPIFYDKQKECPKFDKFLESCFKGDDVRMAHVLEMMALCFIKKYIIQKGYVNYGIGSNGKSTFLNILRNMLGIYNTCSIPMQKFQNSTFIGYELRGKCANISADGGVEPIDKTGFIKQVLGGDALRCEQKYHNPFDIIPFVTLIFTFNELPTVSDSSDGFARKIQPIHWDQNFYGDDRNKEVDKLPFDTDERSGIFNKLIPIMQRLIETRQLSFENTVEQTKSVWLSRSDSFFRFRTEMLSKGSKFFIEVGALRAEYDSYCDSVGMTSFKKRAFNDGLMTWLGSDTRGNKLINGKTASVWYGFTIAKTLTNGNEQLDKKKEIKNDDD